MQAVVNQDTVKRFINIVSENFSNGIRDDFIDTTKILRIFSANYPEENIFRDSLIDIIHTNGLETSGRFYFISDDNVESILFFFDEILKKSPIAYYSTVFRKHLEYFARLNIFSQEILKKVLHYHDKRHVHYPQFSSANKSVRLDTEVIKIFKKFGKPLSIEDVQKKLPYVPTEKISMVLADKKIFFMTQKSMFVLISKLQFDVKEIEETKNKLFLNASDEGYTTFEDCDLSSNYARNLELSNKDMQSVIYEKFLSKEFIKRGNKLYPKKDLKNKGTLTLTDTLKRFIESQNELSVKKLIIKAQNLGITQTVALSIAHKRMTRVDENFFVKDSQINFTISEIDKALESFVQGKIIPLRAVTSFTSFPPIEGYVWNLFLLKSFLRKHSQKYVFNSTSVNNSTTGSIYPKSMKFEDYLEVQVAAVIQERIPIKKSEIEDFLIEQGYRVMRYDSVTERIIRRAHEILNL